MTHTLGIDAGGTYTDAVLLDPPAGRVTSTSKALTTTADLSVGIARSIAGLEALNPEHIKLVSISTTLATNAIVEEHGGRVALLVIGYDREIMEREGLDQRLPVEAMCYVDGGHDLKGEEVRELDIEAAREAILAHREGVDAFAISGYFSVMNPEHERRVRDLIAELTPVPVVCGHELSSDLNALRRVSTTVLNARLLPLIQRLVDSVKKVLAEQGINAPLMLVKGDGSLVSERVARRRPVETILSGPAASAVGARFLAERDDAIVVDVGGTTTDIAVLEDGLPWTNPAGATVAGWQTNVRAADLRTIGMGGDSHVRVERGKLRVGPQRAVPLCRLGADHPAIVRELASAAHAGPGELDARPTEFLTLTRSADGLSLSESEQAVLRALEDGPRPRSSLRELPGLRFASTERLEALGVVREAGLTPTDLLWEQFQAVGGSKSAARAGAEVVAKRLRISVEELTRRVVECVVDGIAREILDKLVEESTGESLFPAARAWDGLLHQILGHGSIPTIDCQLAVRQPIVAVGAPVKAFMPQVADKLHTECLIPDHAEVGNAVGAVVAGITHTVEVFVQPRVVGGGTATYLIHSPQGREEARSFERAVRIAEETATQLARRAAYRSGAEHVSVRVDRRKVDLGKLAEMTIRASATGRPRLSE